MRILLLSAYDALSHQYWAKGLQQQFPEYSWTVLSLPARHFAWRFRANAMQYLLEAEATLQRPYDLLLATSMTDLATLKGLVPQLAALPSIVYCHENQFAYPLADQRYSPIEKQMTSTYTALAADRLVFNSQYNCDSFLAGVQGLLSSVPDRLEKPVVDRLARRIEVLPVPMQDLAPRPLRGWGQPLQIVWNHRWEYDKGPDRLLAFVRDLLDTDIQFVLHLCGQQFRQQPEGFARLRDLLASHAPESLGQWGFMPDRAAYEHLLQQADIVLSTAEHDFQGLSVLEAVQRGCVPLLPARLAYPEWFAGKYCYPSLDDAQSEAKAAVAQLQALLASARETVDVSPLCWAALRPAYQNLLQSQAGR